MPRTGKIYILLLSILLLVSCSGEQRGHVTSSPGTLSLEGYDFNRDGIIPLNFRWEFYWKQLLSPADFNAGKQELTGYIKVPGVWNGYSTGKGVACGDGYATYRLLIKNMPAGAYGLKIPSMATAYRFWVNDHEVASNGKVASDREMVPQQMPTAVFFKTGGGDVMLTVQVSNYYSDKGGMWEKVLLGTEDQVMKQRILAVAFDLILFGSILIMSLYHFALYLFRRKTGFTVYFGLVCFVVALRVLLTGEFFLVYVFPGINWSFEIKTEFITVYAGFAFFLMFLNSLYREEFSRKAVNVLVGSCCLFLVLTVILPVRTSALLLPVFHAIIVSGFLYILYVLAVAVKIRREGAVYILAGCMVLVLVVINDILDSNAVIHTDYLFPVGLLLFIFTQSVILARIFSVSMNRVEELSSQLQESYNRIDDNNKNLESMIGERTAELADANRKLKELDRAKTNFFANISHELRTPLTLILAPVEDALSGRQMTLDSLEMIQRNGRSLLMLINDLLDISRIAAGRMTLEVRECDLCGIVSRCCREMEQAAVTRGLTVTCETPGAPVNAYVDEERMVRVITNFFSNSLKFTRTGGFIRVKVFAGDGCAHVEFMDTGCGIPPDKIGSVFDRFVQAGAGMARRHEGTGLGLSIVRDLVELHGGTVTVESRCEEEHPLDHGSVFRVEIPSGIKHLENRRDIIFTGKSDPAAPVFSLSNTEIENCATPVNMDDMDIRNDDLPALLVVEDNNDLRKLLKSMLSASFTVYTASNGNEAVALLEENGEIDLVVSDIMMPGMDGYELLLWMRDSSDFNGIPVIFLTARADHFMKIEALGLGAVDYVTKPFNSDELLLRIKNQMEQKRMRNSIRRNYEMLLSKIRKPSNFNSGSDCGDLAAVDRKNSGVQHEDIRMEQVCSFIREHYFEDITRESLAAAVDLNPDTFSRLFNNYTGKNLADYINEYRVNEAKKKLAETDTPVTRISLETGFDCIRTFNRVFKKHTGMNPGEFRESVN